jgi:hypothetical protein
MGVDTSNTIDNFDRFEAYHSNVAHQGTLWTSGACNGNPVAVPVPNFLAISNALVDPLGMQGLAVTPYDVLANVDGFLESSSQTPGHKWEGILHWCVVAGQVGPSGKSKVFLDTTPITIDNKDFDR